MKKLITIALFSIGVAFLTQPVFADSKAQDKDDGPAMVCKSVSADGKAAGVTDKLAPSVALGARGEAKPCCTTPDGATCYAHKCGRCKKMCNPKKDGAQGGPVTKTTPTGK